MIVWSTYLWWAPGSLWKRDIPRRIRTATPIELRICRMKFLADCMLGKLAKWLRILGYDTVYDNFAPDDDLLADADAQQRILLTRDRGLADRAAQQRRVICIHIDDNVLNDQLEQLVVETNFDLDRPTFTRCLKCNVEIQPASLDNVRSLVPPYVLKTRTAFCQCPSCRRAYWSGSHTNRMEGRLDSMRRAVAARSTATTDV